MKSWKVFTHIFSVRNGARETCERIFKLTTDKQWKCRKCFLLVLDSHFTSFVSTKLLWRQNYSNNQSKGRARVRLQQELRGAWWTTRCYISWYEFQSTTAYQVLGHFGTCEGKRTLVETLLTIFSSATVEIENHKHSKLCHNILHRHGATNGKLAEGNTQKDLFFTSPWRAVEDRNAKNKTIYVSTDDVPWRAVKENRNFDM